MGSNNNFFDGWLKMQQQSMGNLMGMSQQVADAMTKGESVNQYADIYTNWFNQQKSMIESMQNNGHTQANGANAFTNPFANFGGNNFGDVMKQQMELWQKMAQQANAMQSFQKMYGSANPMMGQLTNAMEQWQKFYADWFNNNSGSFADLKNFGAGNFTQSTLDSVMKSSEVYLKLFDVFKPMIENMRKMQESAMNISSLDNETIVKWMNPEKYREVIDKVFQFSSPEKMKEQYDRFAALSQQYMAAGKDSQAKMTESLKLWQEKMFNGDLSNFGDLQHLMLAQMQDALKPMKRLLPYGEGQLDPEAITNLQAKYTKFWQSYNEFQYLVYQASYQSAQKVAEEAADKFKNSAEVPNYKDLYNHWLNATETILIDTFGSDKFSATQGELMTLGLDIKHTLETELEKMLASYPVVTRSEADELIAIIQDLKDRVRILEKKLAADSATTAEEKTAKKAVKVKE